MLYALQLDVEAPCQKARGADPSKMRPLERLPERRICRIHRGARCLGSSDGSLVLYAGQKDEWIPEEPVAAFERDHVQEKCCFRSGICCTDRKPGADRAQPALSCCHSVIFSLFSMSKRWVG